MLVVVSPGPNATQPAEAGALPHERLGLPPRVFAAPPAPLTATHPTAAGALPQDRVVGPPPPTRFAAGPAPLAATQPSAAGPLPQEVPVLAAPPAWLVAAPPPLAARQPAEAGPLPQATYPSRATAFEAGPVPLAATQAEERASLPQAELAALPWTALEAQPFALSSRRRPVTRSRAPARATPRLAAPQVPGLGWGPMDPIRFLARPVAVLGEPVRVPVVRAVRLPLDCMN